MEIRAMLPKIAKDIEQLSLQEQLLLVETIVHRLRTTGMTEEKALDWSELYGLGKGLWNDEDAQEYVDRLRSDRHDPD